MRTHGVVFAALLVVAGCQRIQATHESRLILEHHDGFVVPSLVRDSAGRPFTGRAYGTFFGETSMDCVEWEGTFVSGLPHGEFLIYRNCDKAPRRVRFEQGARVTVPDSSFKPNQLRGSAQFRS